MWWFSSLFPPSLCPHSTAVKNEWCRSYFTGSKLGNLPGKWWEERSVIASCSFLSYLRVLQPSQGREMGWRSGMPSCSQHGHGSCTGTRSFCFLLVSSLHMLPIFPSVLSPCHLLMCPRLFAVSSLLSTHRDGPFCSPSLGSFFWS